MYKLSTNIRKYSPTPIVEIIINKDGSIRENIVLLSPLKKKEGDELFSKILKLLNESI